MTAAINRSLCEFHFVRYTMDRPRFTDHLEAIKFICKDFWSEIFKKQIDNLKTNHRVSFWHSSSENSGSDLDKIVELCYDLLGYLCASR